MRKLLEAGLAEFDENGFQAVRVDDVVRRANISHGTFYLYFSNKDDLFKTLLRDALDDMQVITDDFPVVTRNESGLAALRKWTRQFCDIYSAHAAVLRILTQADVVGEEVYGDGLQQLFRLAEAITQGMTAGAGRLRGRDDDRARRAHRGGLPDDAGAGQLPVQRGGPAAQGRDDGPAQLDHLRRLPPRPEPGPVLSRAGRDSPMGQTG